MWGHCRRGQFDFDVILVSVNEKECVFAAICVQGVCVSMVLACVCAFVTVCMAVTSSMAMFENVYFTQCMHTHTHARTHARTHPHTHTHTHTLSLSHTHSHLSQWLQSLVRKRRFVKKCGLINRQVSAATGHEYSSLCAATFNHGLTGPLHPSYINPNSKRRPHHQHNNHKQQVETSSSA